MAKIVEIDETEFLRSEQLRKTVEQMLAHPQAAKLVEQARKLVDPNAPTPHLDREKPINEAVDAIKQTIAEFKKEQAEQREKDEQERAKAALEAKWNAGKSKLRERQYTDEGIAAVEKLMAEHNILDHEIAAAAFERLHPPATPTTPFASGAFGLFEAPAESDDLMKKLIESRGENPGVVRQMVDNTLAEMRGHPRR